MEELLAGLDPVYGKTANEFERVLLEVGGEKREVECGKAGFVAGMIVGAAYGKGEAYGAAMMVLLTEGIKAEEKRQSESNRIG